MVNQYDSEDNMEVYTPDIGNSEEIGIDQSTTSYSKRLNRLKVGEIIDVKLNEKAIKWRISHDLYKDFRSGIRELFQNEARACRQSIKKYNAKSKIEVRINPDTRDLVIHGIDSLGISEAVFDKVLRVLGVSGNTDGGTEVGQFGMGFASYTTLSDMIKIETWYRDNREDGSEQRYAFLGDNGIDFKILPEPEMDTYGTKLSLTYNKNDNTTGIIDMLTECVKFCGVPVTLIIESDWNTYHKFGQQGIYELETFKGLTHCLETQLAEKHNMYNEVGDIDWHKQGIKFYKRVHIDNEDYEFVGLIAMTQHDSYSNKVSGVMNYHLLATVPIEITFNPHGSWTSYALNIKNERKFMPTADRDRLTNDAEKQIQDMFDKDIRPHFGKYSLESIEEYTKSLDKAFYEDYYHWEDVIDHEVYEETQTVMNTLDKHFTTSNGRSKKLRTMLATNNPLFVLKALNSDYMARIQTKEENALFFRYKENDERNNSDRYEEVLTLLKEAGVISGEQYIKDNKIRSLTKREKTNGVMMNNSEKPIRLTNAGYRAHHTVGGELPFGCSRGYGRGFISTTVGDVNKKYRDNMLIFDVKTNTQLWNNLKDNLWTSQSNYVIMRNIKGLDSDNIKSYTQWVKDLQDKPINFLKEKTIKAKALSSTADYHYIMGKKKDLDSMIKGTKLSDEFNNHIIVADHEELFEIMWSLIQRTNSINTYGGKDIDDLIKEASGLTEDYSFYCNDATKKIIYSKIPKYQTKMSKPMFDIFMRAIASKPYDHDIIMGEADEIISQA